jgi:hypothetical protein
MKLFRLPDTLNILLLSFFFSLVFVAVFFLLINYTNFLNYFLAIIYSIIAISTTIFTEINHFFNSIPGGIVINLINYFNLLLEDLYSFEFIKDIMNFLFNLVYFISSLHVINVLIILLPVLLSVAFMTIIERKQLAAHQRRVGPVKWFGKSLLWVKLSNSGDSLKTTVPNYIRKIISGWTNLSG